MEMINKNEAKLEISMIFVQPSSRLMYFLMGWLLVLGLKDCLVKCATVCVRSMVILLYIGPFCDSVAMPDLIIIS